MWVPGAGPRDGGAGAGQAGRLCLAVVWYFVGMVACPLPILVLWQSKDGSYFGGRDGF